jgi:hypothetical protein
MGEVLIVNFKSGKQCGLWGVYVGRYLGVSLMAVSACIETWNNCDILFVYCLII